MKLIFIQPAVGRRQGDSSYLRSWQMEPLTLATLAGLTPPEIERSFYDDRMERIPFDEPADAVILPVETYTARRSYEIASEFRTRGVKVIAGGFHATLQPDEAQRYAESVVTGEAESVWPELLDDIRHNTLKRRYRAVQSQLRGIAPDRSLYRDKRYLPLALVETGRGCGNACDFCAVQAFFGPTYRRRPIGEVVEEISRLRATRGTFFFVDDNFTGDIEQAKEMARALIPLKIRGWATQISVNAAEDEELLALMRQSGCSCVLIGFESLNPDTLKNMRKGVNLSADGYESALNKLRRHGIGVYATFVFGYDSDTTEGFEDTFDFAMRQGFFITAFNHLIPFPGTPLHDRLAEQARLPDPRWWLNPGYEFYDVPFTPARMSANELRQNCLDLRKRFYSMGSIWKRFNRWARGNAFLARNYFPVNLLLRRESCRRDAYPLGDRNRKGELIEVAD